MSFIAGPHACIGRTMSISEMKAVLACASPPLPSPLQSHNSPSPQRARRQFRVCARVRGPGHPADCRRDYECVLFPCYECCPAPLMLCTISCRTCRRYAVTRAPRPGAHCLVLSSNIFITHVFHAESLSCIIHSQHRCLDELYCARAECTRL